MTTTADSRIVTTDKVAAAHDTLTARGNLANWTGEAGDPARARDLFAELLPDRERVLGPDHPDTLTARNNLASWTKEANRRPRRFRPLTRRARRSISSV